MAETELVLLEEGFVVQSFSGVDFNVLGYVPPYSANSTDESEAVDTNTGDVFFHRMASLQTMSISSTRDHKAARRLGSSWAFDFSRGSRTIAGSLVFAVINGDAFKSFREATSQYNALSREDAEHYLADALPPFNIVFTASNESGSTLVGMLIGVRLTNTGMSFGIHDIYTEQVYSFVAEMYVPMKDITDDLTVVDYAATEDGIVKVFQSLIKRRPLLPTVDRFSRGLSERPTPQGEIINGKLVSSYAAPSTKIRRGVQQTSRVKQNIFEK